MQGLGPVCNVTDIAQGVTFTREDGSTYKLPQASRERNTGKYPEASHVSEIELAPNPNPNPNWRQVTCLRLN